MKYTEKNFTYTDPKAYDDRVRREPIEAFIASQWDPLLFKYLKHEINEQTVVADLGCGTFVHTQHMSKAKHIYAVDINRSMLDHGIPKIASFKHKVTVLCESGTKTSIPSSSCDLVWIDGLSEFLVLKDLFVEIRRILKPGGKFIILYQNRFHPENLLVGLYYWLKNRSGKKYRSLSEFRTTGKRFGFRLIRFHSRAFFLYFPPYIQKHLIPFWKLVNTMLSPLQKVFPIGNNIICEFTKESGKF